MSRNVNNLRTDQRLRRRGVVRNNIVAWGLGAGGALVLLLAIGAWFLLGGASPEDVQLATFNVKRGPLTISIIERGTIKNRQKVVVKSKVEGRNTIIWLIDEGKHVKEGTTLMVLDSSEFEEKEDQQEITVTNADANFIRARENLAVTQSQAESNIATAELDLKFAKLDLKKYVEGEWPKQLQQAQADIDIAEAEYLRAKDQFTWTERLAKEEYVTRTELEADHLAVKRRKLDLEMAKTNLHLLKTYTHKRDLEKLQSDVKQAERQLERTRRQASADIRQAEVEPKAKKSQLKRQKDRLEDLKENIANCTIRSPVDGQVVYATSAQRSRWGNNEPMDEGQEVRQRQELFHLPTANGMMAEIKIQESGLKKVRESMPVKVTIGALEGKTFSGSLAKIAPLPDPQSFWMNPDLKVFNSEVYIDQENNELRPGMSCTAEIIVKQYQDVLYVPIQTVQRVDGKPTVYVVNPKTGEATMRNVELGFDNNRVVHITSGLQKGEQVLLTPPLKEGSASQAVHSTTQPAKSSEKQLDKDSGQPQRGKSQTPENGGNVPKASPNADVKMNRR